MTGSDWNESVARHSFPSAFKALRARRRHTDIAAKRHKKHKSISERFCAFCAFLRLKIGKCFLCGCFQSFGHLSVWRGTVADPRDAQLSHGFCRRRVRKDENIYRKR